MPCPKVPPETPSCPGGEPGDLVSVVVELLEAHQRRFGEALRADLEQVLGCRALAAPARVSERSDWAKRSTEAVVVTLDHDHELDEESTVQSSPSVDRSLLLVAATKMPAETNAHDSPAKDGNLIRSAGSAVLSRLGYRHQGSQQSNQHSDIDDVFAQVENETSVLKYSWFSVAGKVVQAPAFGTVVCILVALNAVSIGVHANWTMKNLAMWNKEPPLFRTLDLVFSAAFLIELLLRITGEGWHFFSRSNRSLAWNFLDTLLVLSVLLEEFLSLFLVSSPNVTVLRLLRSLRTVRVVRLFRVTRFSSDLRLMVMGIFCAARSLFWLIVLLLIVMYIFAVCIMQMTAASVTGSSSAGEGVPDDKMLEYFGSLESTMYVLYKSACGGLEWGLIADELGTKGALLAGIYAVYISFTTLCILNIVTGVFVQNASTIAQNDQLEMRLEHLERRRERQREVEQLFNNLGEIDENGRIDWPHFKTCVTNPAVQACFTKLGLDMEYINARGLFRLFDVNDDGKIDLHEFARGIDKLHGNARNFDLHLVSSNTMRVLRQVRAKVADMQLFAEPAGEVGAGGPRCSLVSGGGKKSNGISVAVSVK